MNNIILFLLCITSAAAQDFVFDKEKGRAVPTYIGQLKIMKGKIFKKNESGTQEVKTGERFRKNDVLVTREKAFAKILIVDETLISIGPNSELKFDELEFIDKNDRQLTMTLIKGQLTGNVKNKAKKPGDVTFRTTYTSMGVRGTYVLMSQETLKTKDIVQYALLSGKAQVTDTKNQKFDLEKGDKVTIIKDLSNELSQSEKAKLPEEEFKQLESPEIDENKEFKPFLKYFDESSDAEAQTVLHTGAENPAADSRKVEARREDVKPHWKENLKKLNEKLKENQKKR